MLREGIAVEGLWRQRSGNHHLQRTGKEVSLFTVFHGGEVLSGAQLNQCCSRPRPKQYKGIRLKSRNKKRAAPGALAPHRFFAPGPTEAATG